MSRTLWFLLLAALALGLVLLAATLAREEPRESRAALAPDLRSGGGPDGEPARALPDLRGVPRPAEREVARAPEESWSSPDAFARLVGDTLSARPSDAPPTVISGPVTRAYYPDGQLEFEGGQALDANGQWILDGPWRAWHPNGQLHELGAYALGEDAGPWEWWYENGERMAVGTFVDGKREGFWRYWHEDGALMTECSYRDGKAHGLWSQYHPKGHKTAEGRFEHGELAGTWVIWNEDGSLNLDGTGSYADGEKVAE